MKVSIIIPVYNVAPYIERCLQSIIDQTYHDFDCIIIDDRGTDGSMLIVEQFVQIYNGDIRFSIIRHQQNEGISASRNTGMKAATGDYLFFIDSDDAITPDCIEILARLARQYPDADFVQGNIITGTSQLMEGDIDEDVPEYCNNRKVLEDIILVKTHRTAWNRLIKRTFLIDNSLFFPVGILMEDHYWLYFVSKHVHAATFTHRGTYYYYNNGGSLINSPSKASLIKRYSSYITVVEDLVSDMLLRHDIRRCHRTYIGEALAFCMINLYRLHSLSHWLVFWDFAWHLAWKIRTRLTWQQFRFLICLLPPLCFMIGIKGWCWRLRQYIAWKL